MGDWKKKRIDRSWGCQIAKLKRSYACTLSKAGNVVTIGGVRRESRKNKKVSIGGIS